MYKPYPLLLPVTAAKMMLSMGCIFVPVGFFNQSDLSLVPIVGDYNLTAEDGAKLPVGNYLVSRWLTRDNELSTPQWLDVVKLPPGEYQVTFTGGEVPPGQQLLVWELRR